MVEEKCPGCGKGELVHVETYEGRTIKKYSCGHRHISVSITETIAISDTVDAVSKKVAETSTHIASDFTRVAEEAIQTAKIAGLNQVFINYTIGTSNVQLGAGANIMLIGDAEEGCKKIFELIDNQKGLTQSQRDNLKKIIEEIKESAQKGRLDKIKEKLQQIGQYSWLIEPVKSLVSLIIGQNAGLIT